MLLPDNNGQVVPSYGGPEFAAEAAERLPEMAEAMRSCSGLLHPVMGELAAAGREAIGTGDLSFLRRLFALVASAAERPDAVSEFENAIALSFLEPHDFEGPNGGAALDLMPDRLRALMHEAV